MSQNTCAGRWSHSNVIYTINERDLPEAFKYDRRHFIETAAITIAAAQLGLMPSSDATSRNMNSEDDSTINLDTNSSLGPLKQI